MLARIDTSTPPRRSVVYFRGTEFDPETPTPWVGLSWGAGVAEAKYGSGPLAAGKVMLPLIPVELTAGDRVFKFTALVDTGAIQCNISRRAVLAAGLKPISRVENMGVGGTVEVGVYEFGLNLPDLQFASHVRATEMPDMPGFDVLIGALTLRHLRFSYDGPAGRYSLSFP